jgi:hypothetical protein
MRRRAILNAALRWSGVVALIATAGWNLYKFDLGGGSDWMVNVDIATEVLPYSADLRLLAVHVKTKNPTTSRISFKRQLSTFTLDVKAVPPGLAAMSALNLEHSPLTMPRIDLMAGDGSERIYMPSAELDDTEFLILHANSLVHLSALLTRKEGLREEPDEVLAERVVFIPDK